MYFPRISQSSNGKPRIVARAQFGSSRKETPESFLKLTRVFLSAEGTMPSASIVSNPISNSSAKDNKDTMETPQPGGDTYLCQAVQVLEKKVRNLEKRKVTRSTFYRHTACFQLLLSNWICVHLSSSNVGQGDLFQIGSRFGQTLLLKYVDFDHYHWSKFRVPRLPLLCTLPLPPSTHRLLNKCSTNCSMFHFTFELSGIQKYSII